MIRFEQGELSNLQQLSSYTKDTIYFCTDGGLYLCVNNTSNFGDLHKVADIGDSNNVEEIIRAINQLNLDVEVIESKLAESNSSISDIQSSVVSLNTNLSQIQTTVEGASVDIDELQKIVGAIPEYTEKQYSYGNLVSYNGKIYKYIHSAGGGLAPEAPGTELGSAYWGESSYYDILMDIFNKIQTERVIVKLSYDTGVPVAGVSIQMSNETGDLYQTTDDMGIVYFNVPINYSPSYGYTLYFPDLSGYITPSNYYFIPEQPIKVLEFVYNEINNEPGYYVVTNIGNEIPVNSWQTYSSETSETAKAMKFKYYDPSGTLRSMAFRVVGDSSVVTKTYWATPGTNSSEYANIPGVVNISNGGVDITSTNANTLRMMWDGKNYTTSLLNVIMNQGNTSGVNNIINSSNFNLEVRSQIYKPYVASTGEMIVIYENIGGINEAIRKITGQSNYIQFGQITNERWWTSNANVYVAANTRFTVTNLVLNIDGLTNPTFFANTPNYGSGSTETNWHAIFLYQI